MNIKPIYDTGTITFMDAPEKVSLTKIDTSFVKDPKGVIPNGIYKVFKHEGNIQTFLLILNALIILTSVILISLFGTNTVPVHWFWYTPVTITMALALVKLTMVLLDKRALSSSIVMYREALVAGSRLTPPFISALYIKMHKKQVKQNWSVIAIMFYGTIITLLFWWLKDVNWWIFEFKNWIHNLTKNPELVGAIMVSVLVFVLVLHIYFTIYRKKRIIDIQSFFGNEVISQVEINEIVSQKNKVLRRAFFLSILIILIFPFIGWIIYKKVKK